MSRIQNYFPPNGTKHPWHPKALNYSPWTCRIWECRSACITARVNLEDNGMFCWSVEVVDFRYQREYIGGEALEPLDACLAAEQAGMKVKENIWQPWMQSALDAGWRTP